MDTLPPFNPERCHDDCQHPDLDHSTSDEPCRSADGTALTLPPHAATPTAERLEYLRGELRAASISYAELAELQSLADQIDPGDVELLEAAGVPEFPEGDDT